MMIDRIYDLKNEEKAIESKLLALAKKDELTEPEKNEMVMLREKLKEINQKITNIKNEFNNWSCSYSYKSVNGKVEKKYEINGKEVDERQYRKFVARKNLLPHHNRFLPPLRIGGFLDNILGDGEEKTEDDIFDQLW